MKGRFNIVGFPDIFSLMTAVFHRGPLSVARAPFWVSKKKDPRVMLKFRREIYISFLRLDPEYEDKYGLIGFYFVGLAESEKDGVRSWVKGYASTNPQRAFQKSFVETISHREMKRLTAH
jgi:hypothetical protein